jgi:hypothetical protein
MSFVIKEQLVGLPVAGPAVITLKDLCGVGDHFIHYLPLKILM